MYLKTFENVEEFVLLFKQRMRLSNEMSVTFSQGFTPSSRFTCLDGRKRMEKN